jgi:hypothetical protein
MSWMDTNKFSFYSPFCFVIRHLLSSLNPATHTHTGKESILHGTWRSSFFSFFFFRQTDIKASTIPPSIASSEKEKFAMGAGGHRAWSFFFSFSLRAGERENVCVCGEMR